MLVLLQVEKGVVARGTTPWMPSPCLHPEMMRMQNDFGFFFLRVAVVGLGLEIVPFPKTTDRCSIDRKPLTCRKPKIENRNVLRSGALSATIIHQHGKGFGPCILSYPSLLTTQWNGRWPPRVPFFGDTINMASLVWGIQRTNLYWIRDKSMSVTLLGRK